MQITFDTSELDQTLWESRTLAEAKKIYANPSTRRGRQFTEVFSATKRGQAAEVWLMSKGFLDDPRPYRDVLKPDRTPIEVKVTDWEPRYILDRYAEKLRSGWGDNPKIVYLFRNEEGQSLYEFYGIFTWNGERFIGDRPQL